VGAALPKKTLTALWQVQVHGNLSPLCNLSHIDELSKIMRKAYTAVSAIAKEKNSNLRTAAFVLAIRRVGRAALSRRHISENIRL
jgi:hypothetical protein